MVDYFGVVLTAVVGVIGVLVTFGMYFSRRVETQNDLARESCIGIYDAFSEFEVADLPESVRQAWQAGRAIREAG